MIWRSVGACGAAYVMLRRFSTGFLVICVTMLVMACSDLPINRPIPFDVSFPINNDFESGSLIDWHTESANAGSISMLTPPAAMNGSAAALRLVVTPSDVANHGNRAELARYNVAQWGDDVYYGWDAFIPVSDPDDFGWQIIMQLYQLPDFQRGENFDFWFIHPPVTLTREPGKLVLMTTVGGEKRRAETAFAKGVSHRIILHVRLRDNDDGLIELWLDGLPVSSGGSTGFAGPTLHNRAGAYLKLGLYRGAPGQTQAPSTNTIWIDNVKLSRSWAEVQ